MKVYPIATKDEVLQCFEEYTAIAEAQFGKRISRIRCDNGGEYRGSAFVKFCRKKGIQVEYTVPYTPEQNGISERMNRTLEEKARSMLVHSGISKEFRGEAVETAAYLTNRSPASALEKNTTPFELWNGTKPDISNLRVFGCTAYCHIPKQHRKKLDSKSWKCILVGYAKNGYRVFNPKNKKIAIVRDVVFDENVCGKVNVAEPKPQSESGGFPIFRRCESIDSLSSGISDAPSGPENPEGSDTGEESSDSDEESAVSDEEFEGFTSCDEMDHGEEEVLEEDQEANDVQQESMERSHRIRNPPVWQKDFDMDFAGFALSAIGFVEDLPDTLQEMRKRDDWPKWQTAIHEEMDSLTRNRTWTLTELPAGRKPISCKWIFKVKPGANGEPDRYKARLVARGFTQRYGYDYTETYAPVARLNTLRAVLAVANQQRLLVHQMDVRTAFLNGQLKEEIYMVQPEGFQQGNGLVCRLNRSIYGLKQASRAWNDRFHQFVTSIGFKRSDNDPCLYIRSSGGEKVFLILYVDDILIVGHSLKAIRIVKTLLSKQFEMVDLGAVSNFLGMHIERDVDGRIMRIDQQAYLNGLLKRFGMDECRPVSTPIECHLKLQKGEEGQRTDKPYRELVGCLMYVTLASRPDLSASVNYMSQYQSCPTVEHWVHLKRILRYVKGTLSLVLEFRGDDREVALTAFSDADWANDVNDRRSVTGYLFKIFGSTSVWLTRKQPTVSLSSTEAEFVALCTAACEGVWLVRLLADLGIVLDGPVTYYEDNQSCIRVAEEPRDSRRMKHVEVKYYFIRDLIKAESIRMEYVPSEDQQADILTKGLPTATFVKLREILGLKEY